MVLLLFLCLVCFSYFLHDKEYAQEMVWRIQGVGNDDDNELVLRTQKRVSEIIC